MPGGRSKAGTTGAFAIVAVLAIATVALGRGAGNLTFKDCVKDRGAGVPCGKKTDGLAGAIGIALSPKGDSAYVATDLDSAIVWLDRKKSSGRLTPKGCVGQKGVHSDCSQTMTGLEEPRAVAVSPDGDSVYAGGPGDKTLVWLKRKSSGKLKPKGCIQDNDRNAHPCKQTAKGLNAPSAIAVSPDGKSVYVAAFTDNAISVFKRDKQTGKLSERQCITDNDETTDNCDRSTDGLQNPEGVVVAPNGKAVYATGEGDDAVVAFTRNTSNGKLTPIGCVMDNDTTMDSCNDSANGLNGAWGLAVAQGPPTLYVTSVFDDAVGRFSRDTSTGEITHQGCTQDNDTGTDACAGSADGLSFPEGVAIDKAGTAGFVTSAGDWTVDRFQRSTSTGGFSGAECIKDTSSSETCDDTVTGLEGVGQLAISPQDNSLYTAATIPGTVDWFKLEP
jgi:DNA-binding beta-propeller fold protein YncE